MDFLSRLFGSKDPVESMDKEKLREMEIKLNSKISSLQSEIKEVDNEIQANFEKAKQAKTKSEETSFARRIKTLSQKKEMKQKAHGQIEKELRAVSNMLILKEHEADLKSSGVWNDIKNLSPDQLESWLVSKNLEAEDREHLVSSVVDMTSSAMSTGVEYEEDLDDILDTIRSVKDGDMEPEEARDSVTKEKDSETEK